ncbi:MAG TPA: sugar phosphate nucleotidyltransferase [Stellaceae bacterium]|nr:sugar phosphate nucleotidyltransferase [Stellaceae bacterium]
MVAYFASVQMDRFQKSKARRRYLSVVEPKLARPEVDRGDFYSLTAWLFGELQGKVALDPKNEPTRYGDGPPPFLQEIARHPTARNMAGVDIIHPVILSRGLGTQPWPMSVPPYPKQLLSLVGGQSLLQETARWVADPQRFAPPLVICNEEHRFIISEQLRAADIVVRAVMLEPAGRNTAPAACLAALTLVQEADDPLILLLPSDHAISNAEAFCAAVEQAAAAGSAGRAFVAFGINPERVESVYGYIRRSKVLDTAAQAYSIAEFVDKPDPGRAQEYIESGEYSWNSGMFLFRARLYLEELERLRPDILRACREALAASKRDADFIEFDKTAFAACPAESIDRAVMEHTSRAVVVPVGTGWR